MTNQINKKVIELVKLVRRGHDAENCPHKGNCLNEVEMLSKLQYLLSQIEQEAYKRGLQRAIEILEESAKAKLLEQ